MNSPLLAVADVAFRFGNRFVLDALSFTLAPGVHWLRGPNGTGKTTLLKLLAGALKPARGDILLCGRSLAKLSPVDREAIFLCADDLPHLHWLTAGELIAVYASIYRSIDITHLDSLLGSFRLTSLVNVPIEGLSLGERKKLQMAVALSVNVRLLLLDEPFNGIDAAAAALVRTELHRRCGSEGDIVILTSHTDPGLALKPIDLLGGPASTVTCDIHYLRCLA